MSQIKVRNMQSPKGNDVPNQFLIRVKHKSEDQAGFDSIYFQSYDSIIAVKNHKNEVTLDENYWNYSVTTGKYRNEFLGEDKADTERKIKSGEYKLADLNN